MTRFARATGSKASNERVPEQATSWREMKNDMEKTKQQTEFEKERLKMNEVRQKQYDEYLEKINNIEKTWADFPKPPKPSVQKVTPKKKSRAIDVTEDDVTDEMIDEFCAVDLNVDETLEGLKNQIEACLQKKRRKETKTNGRVNKEKESSEDEDTIEHKNYVSLQKLKITDNSEESDEDRDETKNFVSLKNLSINDSSDESDEDTNEIDEQASSDEAPEEQSAKIAPVEVVKSKKQKNKKKSLKIESVTPKKPESETQQNIVENSSKGKKKKKGKKKETIENAPVNAKNNQKQPENGAEHSKGKKNKRKSKNNENETITEGKKQKLQNPPVIEKKQQKQTKNPADNSQVKKNTPGKKQNNPQVNDPKRKQPKVRDNKEHKPRKPNQINKIVINGIEQELVKFQGIPINPKEAERLTELRKQMISRGIPRSEVERKLKLERRRAEKQISRQRRLVCFQCRKSGHMLSECPEVSNSTVIESATSGYCFKCGSTEHTYLQCRMNKTEGFKFATCFICREQGHIARECPDNPKGLYPQGGACKLCGDVTHLKKDCPKRIEDTQENTMFLNTISDGNIESLEESTPKTNKTLKSANKNKIVKF